MAFVKLKTGMKFKDYKGETVEIKIHENNHNVTVLTSNGEKHKGYQEQTIDSINFWINKGDLISEIFLKKQKNFKKELKKIKRSK